MAEGRIGVSGLNSVNNGHLLPDKLLHENKNNRLTNTRLPIPHKDNMR